VEIWVKGCIVSFCFKHERWGGATWMLMPSLVAAVTNKCPKLTHFKPCTPALMFSAPGCPAWHHSHRSQRELNRLITQTASRHEHITLILSEMHWLPVQYQTELKPTCSNTAWPCITVSNR